jgi:cytochrome P450
MEPRYCPAYPRPVHNRWMALWRALTGRASLLNQVSETAYRMKMGRMRAPGLLTFIVNEPAAVRQVMVEQNDRFPKHRVMLDLLKPLLGRSIFTSNGPAWERQRKLMEPAFETTRMEHAFPRMRASTDALMERLAKLPTDQACDVEREMTHFTADTIFRTIFSTPLEAGDARRIFDCFAAFQEATSRATEPRYRPRWWNRVLPGTDHADAAARLGREIRELLVQQVRPRYTAYHEGAEATEQTDILAALLKARDPDTQQPLSEEELVNEVAVLYLAGHETTSSALSWSLYFLARAPDIQQRVQQELDAVLGHDLQLVELESLRSLDLTRRVFRETLRLYPPLGFLLREASQDCRLRDHEVPAGTAIVVSPWIIHRHRRYWEHPDEFDPDRFLTAAGRASAAQAYLPFSIGPRVCVGAGFAQQEALLVLGTLLRRYEVAPAPGRTPCPMALLTLRSDIGIRLMLRPRAST